MSGAYSRLMQMQYRESPSCPHEAQVVADCLPPELRLAIYGEVIVSMGVRYNTRYSLSSLDRY
jgi:hypothetical protein